MNQSLSSYYVFYMVVEKGNISAASKELFISQPAVSKSVNKLESNLNTKLLIRSTRGVTLTHEGKILYDRLKEAFHSIELGEEQLMYETKRETMHLTIGVSTTLCKYVLLPYTKEFIRKYPHIKLSILCQSSDQTLAALEDGKIDIGLVGEPEQHSNYYTFSKLKQIEDIFVSTQSYLDNLMIRSGIDYKDTESFNSLFQNTTLMLMDKGNLSRRYVDQFILANSIQAENIIEVSTMDLLIEFATIGVGVACVIKNFIEKELKDQTLIQIPTPFQIPKRNIGFAYSKKQYKNPALELFLTFCKEYQKE